MIKINNSLDVCFDVPCSMFHVPKAKELKEKKPWTTNLSSCNTKCQGHNPLAIRIRISISRIRIKCRVFPLFFAARGLDSLCAGFPKFRDIFWEIFLTYPLVLFECMKKRILWKSTLEWTVTFNNSFVRFVVQLLHGELTSGCSILNPVSDSHYISLPLYNL